MLLGLLFPIRKVVSYQFHELFNGMEKNSKMHAKGIKKDLTEIISLFSVKLKNNVIPSLLINYWTNLWTNLGNLSSKVKGQIYFRT